MDKLAPEWFAHVVELVCMADAQVRELSIVELAQQAPGASPFQAIDERSNRRSVPNRGFV